MRQRHPSSGSPEDRAYRYAERYFQRSGCTEYPTVRQCGRALKMRQSDLLEAIEGHELMFTSYYHTEVEPPTGDRFVETLAARRRPVTNDNALPHEDTPKAGGSRSTP